MPRPITLLGVLVSVLLLSASAGGQSEATKQADLITYNKLLTQVKQLDQQYNREMAKAMSVARQRGGEPDLETKARLLSMRDQHDRLMSRLTMLALRHGWELPYAGAEGVARAVAPAPAPHQEVFQGADHIIKARFKEEAARIARLVELPMITPPPSFGGSPYR